MKKIIPILLALIVLLIAYTGYRSFNKPHQDIYEQETDFQITAVDLINEFSQQSDSAGTKYADKTLVISGDVFKMNEGDSTFSLVFDHGLDVVLNVEMDRSIEASDLSRKYLKLKCFYVGLLPGEASFGIPSQVQLKKGIILEDE